ncbi:hypothetical protein [Desulfovibrio sp. JC010]|uniref:hypothetical protein n=1 Tax=Desulfovibrio sp. JC010 TaxID=2593641 RepID=UPI0013D4BFD6|nr:hypothetical protein [Desulfovibrio sp. JC010]
MTNEISNLYKIAATINFLSGVVNEEAGLLLYFLGKEIQKITENIDDATSTPETS